MPRHLHFFSVSLALQAVVLSASAQVAQPAAPAKAVTSAPRPSIEKQDIRAQLSPRRFTTIAAEIGAKISRIPVVEGGSFRAGQVLVSLDCSLQQAQLQKARAALSASERTFAANKRLNELNSVGKVELDVSESEVAKARAEVSLMNVSLEKCQVTAPFAGRVAEQRVREQQYVQPGQAMLDILDDSVLELEFIVPSHWLAWLKPGYGFQVRIDETGKSYPAKILRIGARVDPVSQSVKTVAAIDGSYKELMAGMSGKVSIVPPSGQN
ncbi:efflux RND transporter periplasmic adaptor subunit [Noviherbaspirillum sp. ST9]|uniref:efflux RND transporter periplasmic adaptor subunit n=1 Tax=Noviherbaspirillum sp. ST9 TaxID=3401606 RepID=UPI003B589102